MVMKRNKSFFQTEPQQRKKLFGNPGVFTGDNVGVLQNLQRPGRNVVQVADGGRNNVNTAFHKDLSLH